MAGLAPVAMGVREVLEQVTDRLDPEPCGGLAAGPLRRSGSASRLGRGSERSGAARRSSVVSSAVSAKRVAMSHTMALARDEKHGRIGP